jgi:hypothetical protein
MRIAGSSYCQIKLNQGMIFGLNKIRFDNRYITIDIEELQELKKQADYLHKIDTNQLQINRLRADLAVKLQDLNGRDYLS